MTKEQIVARLIELQDMGAAFVVSREYRELLERLK